MAWLAANTHFDPDSFHSPVVGCASTLADHDSGLHCHGRGQLLFAREGCIRITLDEQLCLLPPTRAAWIPANVRHRAVMRQVVDYRSLWFDATLCLRLPATVSVIDVSHARADGPGGVRPPLEQRPRPAPYRVVHP
jgi:hypothetical protein